MTTRTLTALYDTKTAAEDAKLRLEDVGVSASAIDIHDQGSMAEDGHEGGLFAGIKKMFGAHEDAHAYHEGLTRGHYLLTAKVEDEDANAAVAELDDSGAVDFDAKQTEWKNSSWTGAPAHTRDDTIQIAEERLVVGKRDVDRGGIRVRSYIVETPVSEQVSLREETVSLDRHPVDRAVTGAEDAFRERTIEMTETAEEAVVAKHAIIKEELTIKKDVGQRTEQVSDTVRHTEVEIDRLGGVDDSLADRRV